MFRSTLFIAVLALLNACQCSLAEECSTWVFEFDKEHALVLTANEGTCDGPKGPRKALVVEYARRYKGETSMIHPLAFPGDEKVWKEVRSVYGRAKAALSERKDRILLATPDDRSSCLVKIEELPGWCDVPSGGKVTGLSSKKHAVEDFAHEVLVEFFPMASGRVNCLNEDRERKWSVEAAHRTASFTELRFVKDGNLDLWSFTIEGASIKGEFRRRVGYRGWWEVAVKD